MNDESDGLAGSLRELASEARRHQGPDAHLAPETLTAYHGGELTQAAQEEVQEHLAVCPHCARLLLDLPAFLEAPATDLEVLDGDADASWREIRARLPGPSQPAERQREASSAARPGWWRPWNPLGNPLAAAATLAGAALIAVPLWIIARQLSSPALPPATIELLPPESQRGTAEPPPVPPTIVHAQAASTTFIVRLVRPQPDLRFRVELLAGGSGGTAAAARAPAGRSLPLPAVEVVDSRTLVLVLARRQLAPGRYRLRVLDAEQPSAELLGDYQFEVVEP
jgi:hypothetical protein